MILEEFLREQGFIEATTNVWQLSLNDNKDRFMVVINDAEDRLIICCETLKGRDILVIPTNRDDLSIFTSIKNFCYKWL